MKWSDIADAISGWLEKLAGESAPQPIPVRVDDRRRPGRR